MRMKTTRNFVYGVQSLKWCMWSRYSYRKKKTDKSQSNINVCPGCFQIDPVSLKDNTSRKAYFIHVIN